MLVGKGVVLRPYQVEAISKAEKYLGESDRALMVMATGTGKSRVLVSVAELFSKSLPVLVLVDKNVQALQLKQLFDETYSSGFAELLESDEVGPVSASVHIGTLRSWGGAGSRVRGYTLVILDSVGLNEEIIDSLRAGSLAKTKQLFLTSYATKKLVRIAGNPIFEYSMEGAISDGVLRSVVWSAGQELMQNGLGDAKYISNLLHKFLEIYSGDANRKAIVICANQKEAKRVSETFAVMDSPLKPVLLLSGDSSVEEKYRAFTQDGEYNAVIVVGLYVGMDIPSLTDLVIFKKFSSKDLLQQAITCVMRRNDSLNEPGNVWDFCSNEKLFDPALGSVVIDQSIEVESISSGATTFAPQVDKIEVRKGTDDLGNEAKVLTKADLVCPLEDKPSKNDLLGRSGLVDILKGLIDRESKNHLIVALFGRWGSGKSSVIQMLKDKYSKATNRSFIEFNAWQAEHSNSMAASIANQLVEDLYGSKSLPGQMWLSLKGRMLAEKTALMFEILLITSASLLALYMFYPSITLGEYSLDLSGMIALAAAAPALGSLVWSYYKHPFTGKLRELAKRPNFSGHIGLGHSIREQVGCLLLAYPLSPWHLAISFFKKEVESEHKYILVIDDLDRCSDKKICETLEAIQLIIDLPNVNVLLAVDSDVLLAAVAERYASQRKGLDRAEARSLARDFLGKILQVTVSLDNPSADHKNNFISSKLYSDLVGLPELPSVPIVKNTIDIGENIDNVKLLDFSDFIDEEDNGHDRTTTYLENTREEYEFFVKCAARFDIHNPRTLIRIHNAITLLKGLYPNINQPEGNLKHYIYLAFWYELYSTTLEKTRLLSDICLDGKTVTPASEESPEGIALLEFGSFEKKEILTMLYRVKNMSLPSLDEIENAK